MPTPTDEALTELAARLEQRSLHARVYMHGEMTAVMVHETDDATSTIDDALDEGTGVVGELAAEIGSERGLRDDWLSQIGDDPPTVPQARRMTIRERSLHIVLHASARLAGRCAAAARQPRASVLKKRCALAGIKSIGTAVRLARRMASIGLRRRRP